MDLLEPDNRLDDDIDENPLAIERTVAQFSRRPVIVCGVSDVGDSDEIGSVSYDEVQLASVAQW